MDTVTTPRTPTTRMNVSTGRGKGRYERDSPRLRTRLKEERLRRGWTATQMGEALGVGPNAYRYLESGRKKPSSATLVTACDVLGLTPGDLLYVAPPDADAE